MATDVERKQALQVILDLLSYEDRALLRQSIFDDLDMADTLVENAVGYFALPLSLVPGMRVNEVLYPVIPLAVEETSVVAALKKTLSWINQKGVIRATAKGQGAIGQIHFSKISAADLFCKRIQKNRHIFIQKANEGPAASMVRRGGGVKDFHLRRLKRPDGEEMVILHVMMETMDAMGANVINQTCEFIQHLIEEATGEKALMSILSNLNTEKVTTIEIILEDVDEVLAQRIDEASLVAQLDPYRAVTHNKGIMNGMDAVCLATGNDWRALEAGIHGYAVREGCYRGISQWKAEERTLKGTLTAPITVGIVGGVTKVHPMAALSLRCLGVKRAQDLAFVLGAVGLIQNLAALRALVTEGITQGHMRLHLKNLIRQTNATPQEQALLLQELQKTLKEKKYVTVTDVHHILKDLRS